MIRAKGKGNNNSGRNVLTITPFVSTSPFDVLGSSRHRLENLEYNKWSALRRWTRQQNTESDDIKQFILSFSGSTKKTGPDSSDSGQSENPSGQLFCSGRVSSFEFRVCTVSDEITWKSTRDDSKFSCRERKTILMKWRKTNIFYWFLSHRTPSIPPPLLRSFRQLKHQRTKKKNKNKIKIQNKKKNLCSAKQRKRLSC